MKVIKLLTGRPLPQALSVEELETPTPGPGEVLVRMHAASLNYRDLIVAEGSLSGAQQAKPLIPLSDGAGEIAATGEGVTRWREGDRVVGSFFRDWLDGRFLPKHMQSALGGAIDGVLAEYRLFPETALARMPTHLSFQQAATLPCAALTAWHALFEKTPLLPGETVLVLGTGGVSVFALQFARIAGAKIIATSSSDEKLSRMEQLGASGMINYRARSDWDQAVLELTDSAGVDQIIEVGGAGTLQRSFSASRTGGRVSLIGRLTGIEDRVDPRPIMAKGLTVQGIYVGSVAMLERMVRSIEASGMQPVIDRTFVIDDTAQAYAHLKAAAHFGKVVIEI
ncbi:MAG: NAD(P)-dependent alcohol dehydrogenase [Betaproteobacteria bacterium]|nr:MAG: NAD(P)-dependent alcohol dehydrogenase [Betaproteobacteria bacterium]